MEKTKARETLLIVAIIIQQRHSPLSLLNTFYRSLTKGISIHRILLTISYQDYQCVGRVELQLFTFL